MTYIVDASVAIKWFAPEELRDRALLVLEDVRRLEAPDLILPEVTNIVWKKCLRGELSREQATNALLAIQKFIRLIHPSRMLYARALEMAFVLNHSAYDCFYLACAELRGGVMVTADRRLCDAVQVTEFSRLICHLGDVPATGSP